MGWDGMTETEREKEENKKTDWLVLAVTESKSLTSRTRDNVEQHRKFKSEC